MMQKQNNDNNEHGANDNRRENEIVMMQCKIFKMLMFDIDIDAKIK